MNITDPAWVPIIGGSVINDSRSDVTRVAGEKLCTGDWVCVLSMAGVIVPLLAIIAFAIWSEWRGWRRMKQRESRDFYIR